MKTKFVLRALCAFLTVLMAVAVVPAVAIPVAAADDESGTVDYTRVVYASEEDRLADMSKYYDDGAYSIYVDEMLGVVAYHDNATGENLFTNPWDMGTVETSTDDKGTRPEILSQIIMTYGGSNGTKTLTSYTDAALKGQITVKAIRGGVRVEYAIGERSARILVPQVIERTSFEDKILKPLMENIPGGKTSRDFIKFYNYFNQMFYTDANIKDTTRKSIAMKYPVTEKKSIDIYVCDVNASTKEKRWMESLILAYCPNYSFEQMDQDYDYVEYVEKATSPPVFKMALQYTLEDGNLVVSMTGNGVRFDENVYRIKDFKFLPYMGACYRGNEGYTFMPDGSGAIYALSTPLNTSARVYGDDYALHSKLFNYHNEVMRVPVFGQVETKTVGETSVDRGFFAIIEQGESFAYLTPNHNTYTQYASVYPTFVIRETDTSASDWSVYAASRYVEDYRVRYVMLSDGNKAQAAGKSKYYECSWLGMAFAYRDYLESHNDNFKRLTADDVEENIPLYIETFGCIDTVKKVLSVPVTVSVAMTSFDDIVTMYDYLAGNGVTNVNFKLTGYANGGLYSDVPYKLKWQGSVGGSSGFKDLVKEAEEKGFSVYPDFDFVYTSQHGGGKKMNMKKDAARTIDNRYTAKRVYSATYQTLVSYFQMVVSPAAYSKFYTKLEKKYSRYHYAGISLSTFGSALNSDYNEEDVTLREAAKGYVVEALQHFTDKGYNVMLDAGNAYTWNYATHILNVPLDSSRYTTEISSVPFTGFALHGYKEFTGSAFNMEGNLSYAMLKAMENGAAVYFILSYENTALLKEDELFSQNYSVRYDIWQQKLVDIYLELNSVLADVQTKLIVNHEILDASRVPDEDELLRDIADAAAEAQRAIRERIESDRVQHLEALRAAQGSISRAASAINSNKEMLHNATVALKGQLGAGTDLIGKWIRPGDTATEEQVKKLSEAFGSRVVRHVVNSRMYVREAELALTAAKQAYLTLQSEGVNAQIMDDATADLQAAIAAYAELLTEYHSYTVTVTDGDRDAYIASDSADLDGLTLTKTDGGVEMTVAAGDVEGYIIDKDPTLFDVTYANIGTEGLYGAYLAQLHDDGYYTEGHSSESLIDVDVLYALYVSNYSGSATEPEDDPSGPAVVHAHWNELDSGKFECSHCNTQFDEKTDVCASCNAVMDEEDLVTPDPPKSKYAVDNNVVAVTYGDSRTEPYKTLLLNFNDYAIQVTYRDVIYTIESYGYVAIKY